MVECERRARGAPREGCALAPTLMVEVEELLHLKVFW